MYTCQSCSYSSHTKIGKCPSCGSYGTFLLDDGKRGASKWSKATGEVLDSKTMNPHGERIKYIINHPEFDRIFDTGLTAWGVYLLGGEPGIGKSTIMLQIIRQLTSNNPGLSIAYFSAEERPEHIVARYQRLFSHVHVNKESTQTPSISPSIDWKNDQEDINFEIYHTTDCLDIIATSKAKNYNVIIVDSIQTINAPEVNALAWSPVQVRSSSDLLQKLAKENNIAIFIIWHVTKGGEIAWPKYLEHIVDVVMYLEGDKDGQLRFLRSKKNRFWPADEVGIFEMTLFGLQPVYNLKDRIMSQATSSTPGTVLSIGVDNGRPVLVHIEALLNKSYGKFPIRRAIGVDHKRVDLIIAILEKYCKLQLKFLDIYINVPGERHFTDSGLDLAIAAAIMGQYNNKLASKYAIYLGEVALSGKISKSRSHDKRIKDFQSDCTIIDTSVMSHIIELTNHL